MSGKSTVVFPEDEAWISYTLHLTAFKKKDHMILNFKDDITLEIGIAAKKNRHNWNSKQKKHPGYKSNNR